MRRRSLPLFAASLLSELGCFYLDSQGSDDKGKETQASVHVVSGSAPGAKRHSVTITLRVRGAQSRGSRQDVLLDHAHRDVHFQRDCRMALTMYPM
jgi:hypothetical protein